MHTQLLPSGARAWSDMSLRTEPRTVPTELPADERPIERPSLLALDDAEIDSILSGIVPHEVSADAPLIANQVGVSADALALTRQLAARHLEVIGRAAADAVEGRTKRDPRATKALKQAHRLASEMQDAELVALIDQIGALLDRVALAEVLDHAIIARRLRNTVLALGALAGGAAEVQLRTVCLRRRGLHPLAARLRGLKGIGERRLAKLWDAGLLSIESLVDADPRELVSVAGIDRALATRVIRLAHEHAQERARAAAELIELAASEATEVAQGTALDAEARSALVVAAQNARATLEGIVPKETKRSDVGLQSLAWLGARGEAEVLRAKQLGPAGIERVIAVKRVATANPDGARRERLLAEGRLLARVNHANVVTLLDVLYDHDVPVLALELLSGCDLFTLLDACTKAKRRIPPALAVTIGVRCARGLAAIHQLAVEGQAVAHGDVAHKSVMVTHDGRVKMIDLGVAAYQELGQVAPLARAHAGALTPEVIAGRPMSPASDQFALAVLVWEAMTLRRLFMADTPAATIQNILTLDVATRFERHAFVPDGLQAVLMRALERAPAARYEDVAAFGRALEGWLVDYGLALSDEALGTFVRELVPTPPEHPWR